MREKFKITACTGRHISNCLLQLSSTLLVALGIGATTPVLSQTIVTPSNSDNTYVSSVPGVGTLNNALIDYWYGGNEGQLMGVTWDESGASSTSLFFTINDGVTSIPETITVPAGYTYVSAPDITFSGDNNPSTTNYYVGVIYFATTSLTSLGDIFIDIYEISNPGNSMSATAVYTGLRISTVTHSVGNQHIDIIGKDNGSGNITCDNFVITSQEVNSGSNIIGGLYYSFSSVISSGSFTGALRRSTLCTGCMTPDVAGVEKTAGAGVDDVGIFTYVDISTNDLYTLKWDMSANAVTAASMIDNATSSNPRIDAIDDHLINGTGTLANYDITYAYTSGGNTNIKSYNNLSATPVTCTSGSVTASSFPAIACGVKEEYLIAYGSAFNNDAYAQQISWTTGDLDPNTTPITYYQVNSTTGITSEKVAVSKPCNTEFADYTFVCWYNDANSEIDYKLTDTHPPTFKPAPTNVSNITAGTWSLSPNPVVRAVTLQTANNASGDHYHITDIAGHDVLLGSINGSNQQIDLSRLAAGSYFMNIYASESKVQTIRFVKE